MTADGMPSNSVFDIAQHPSGMMWFITKSGPTYYDAKSWHDFADSLNLPTSNNSKIISNDSIIWVAGLNKTRFTVQFFKDSWTEIEVPYSTEHFTAHISFNVYGVDNDYTITLGADDQLFVYKSKSKEWMRKKLSFNINNIQSLHGRCIIASTAGLWHFDGDKLSLLDLPYEELPTNNILTVADGGDKLLMLGFNWYAEVLDDKIEFLIRNVGLTSSSLTNQSSLVMDKNGQVFFGSATPARMIDHKTSTWQNLLIKGENVNIGSTRIFCDTENNLWVSDSRGLFKFNVLQFRNYNKSSGLAADEVTAITQLQSGPIVLTNPFDFNVLHDGRISNYSYEVKKTLNYRILAIDEDTIQNKLYMATNDQGLLVYNIGDYSKPTKVFSGDRLKFTSVKTFQGTTYIAGNSGIYYLNKDRLVTLNTNSSIRNISTLGDNVAFLSHSEGLFTYDGSTFKNYSSTNFDLKSIYQAVIYEGDTLLATRDGIGQINQGRITHWDKLKIRTPVYGLLVDSQNRLWVGGDHGVYMYNGNKLELFGLDEGLSGNEINRNALIEDKEGNIWIGTEKGVSVFNDQNEIVQNLNLKVNIQGVWIGQDSTTASLGNLTLPYEMNSLRIAYHCLSYVDESKINYRYRISRTSEWIVTSDATSDIVFSNLEPGNYTFQIQARYRTGEWGPIMYFDFKINQPFYRRWWFRLGLIIIIGFAARAIFHFRYLYLIRKQKLLKIEVSNRTREITLLNEQLEQKVKERTIELQEKNKLLEESAFVNAHHLRAPLTKIMSALQIIDMSENQFKDSKVIDILKESVKELDEVIHSINDILNQTNSNNP